MKEEYLKELKDLVLTQETNDFDQEVNHSMADDILCGLLNKLGYEEIVAEYQKIYKWYA